MRIKSSDLLLTTPSVVRWCKEIHGQLEFDIPGSILFIRAGLGDYPKYETSQLEVMALDEHKCGWNKAYSKVPDGVKYSSFLTQTRPRVSPLSRAVTIREDNLLIKGSVTDRIEALKTIEALSPSIRLYTHTLAHSDQQISHSVKRLTWGIILICVFGVLQPPPKGNFVWGAKNFLSCMSIALTVADRKSAC